MSQWGGYLESATQLRCWMGALDVDVSAPLPPQPGPREKASQLERLRALRADLEDHQGAPWGPANHHFLCSPRDAEGIKAPNITVRYRL